MFLKYMRIICMQLALYVMQQNILEYLVVSDCMGFRNADVQRNEMGHNSLLTPLVSLLFGHSLIPCKFSGNFSFIYIGASFTFLTGEDLSVGPCCAFCC